MRDNFNFNMLPIVQDSMNYIPGVRSLTNISSNGYYGYQPPLLEKEKPASQGAHTCFMEVQFENETLNNTGNRKRSWEFGTEVREFKKRRQNECSPFACQPLAVAPSREAKLRTPTHNVPDMPRCIMGHYI